ncbi:MAG: DUF6988 family protein [Pannonibacter sp.]
MQDDEFECLVERSSAFVKWIGDSIHELEVEANPKTELATSLLYVSLLHHSAIVHLFDWHGATSALALLRPQLDAYIRGVWVRQVASEADVAAIQSHRIDLPMAKPAAAELEASGLFDKDTLSKIVKANWSTLCDFTHAGILISSGHYSNYEIKESHSVGLKVQALSQSNAWAAMALIDVYNHTSSPSKADGVLSFYKKSFLE